MSYYCIAGLTLFFQLTVLPPVETQSGSEFTALNVPDRSEPTQTTKLQNLCIAVAQSFPLP